MPDPIIKIKNLTTHYDSRKILDGINLEIYENETFVILGRSGCGKSTLIRHIVGLQKPTVGDIYLFGKNIVNASETEKNEVLKRVGMLFQSAALFNSMSIEENVSLQLHEQTALEASTIKIMTRMKLDLVGLSGFENFLPSQLSGGMKKRAGLARAIAMDPGILFCDEPSAGLDPIVAVGIDHLILKLKKAFKMTIVIVTHELASVFLIADRVAMLHEGKVLAVGTIDEIKKNHHPLIQQFLNRVPDREELDKDKYLQSLVG